MILFSFFGLGWLTPATIAFQMRDPNDFLNKNRPPPNLISCTIPTFFCSFQIHPNFIFAAGQEYQEMQRFPTKNVGPKQKQFSLVFYVWFWPNLPQDCRLQQQSVRRGTGHVKTYIIQLPVQLKFHMQDIRTV